MGELTAAEQADIEAALGSVAGQRRHPFCWAIRVFGDGGGPAFFLTELERMDRDGRRPSRSEASRQFKELFGLMVDSGQVSNHLLKRCHCSESRDY